MTRDPADPTRMPTEPGTRSIDPRTRIGVIQLIVRDLDRAAAFYERSLGFTAEREGRERVYLGADGLPLVTLVHNAAARRVAGSAGLYHLALLVPSRAALANALRRLLRTGTKLDGASDHGVSEALYLADSEGNGIEVYHDRPREAWPRRDGRLAMVTARLDLQSLMLEGEMAGDADLPRGTVIGHVHLKVAEIGVAETFYCDRLGFSLMQRYGDSASFVSAGGYHHHIAFNTWESRDAPPAPPDRAGLDRFEVRLPDAAAREAIVAGLERDGVPITATDGGPLIRDPSGNALVLGVDESLLLDHDPRR